MALNIFTQIFHNIPHFTLTLKKIKPLFVFDLHSDYTQSLIVFVIVTLLVGALLLLTIIITWICQCCTRRDPAVKSRRRVHQLSTILFVISIFCLGVEVGEAFALGISLFANEHINRGVTSSVTGLSYVTTNFRLAYAQCTAMNETFNNATRHVEQLSGEVKTEAARMTDIDEEALADAQSSIQGLGNKFGVVSLELGKVRAILSNVVFLEQARQFGGTAEFERWVLLVTLLSIMLIVLFVGVIAFCRQSKKGTVMFSGLGFAIFIVGWLLFATILPLTIVEVLRSFKKIFFASRVIAVMITWADFCAEGGTFIRNKLSKDMIGTLQFYETCEASQTHDNTPTIMNLKDINGKLSDIQKTASDVDMSLHKLFNDTETVSITFEYFIQFCRRNILGILKIKADLNLILDDVTHSFKGVGALDTQVSCYSFHNDVDKIKQGFCEAGMFGSALLTISLLSLGFFMFLLLLIVSKSWYLFKKLPSDYVEVDDEDPFFPRGNDSTIPVDIYGTHVYNPRTRYANSLDRTEPSTGTTIAPGLPNGSTSTQPSASTALLAGENDWQRATAPPSNPTMFASPPAVGTNSMVRSAYTVRNDDACRYRNYQEQFDV
ncbi:unnamed protein product [Enterobius vermicularis]|uniref:Protein tweety homolog n=1 Tax=Enterobius vermicularis TaxID=51028 RepID=A0A158QAP4_ENTVE|nr:unnamed protein product [Enterobius vermicularis]